MCLALLKSYKITNNWSQKHCALTLHYFENFILVLIFTHFMKRRYSNNLIEAADSRLHKMGKLNMLKMKLVTIN